MLDVGQERILLRLVEAVDLVDEDHRPPARRRSRSASAITALISLIPLSTALNGHELAAGDAGDQPRQRGFARRPAAPTGSSISARRARSGPQRLARTQDVLLAHVVFQPFGPHALGQRPRVVGRSSRMARCRTGSTSVALSGGAPRTVRCRPPRPRSAIPPRPWGWRMPAPPIAASGPTPCPSLPITSAHGPVRSISAGARTPSRAGTPAYRSTRCCLQSRPRGRRIQPVQKRHPEQRSSRSAQRLGIVRTHRAFQKQHPVAPNASAARTMAPALPGSCTPSSTTTSGSPRNSCSRLQCRGLTRAITP